MKTKPRFSLLPVHIRPQSRIWGIPALYISLALILAAVLPVWEGFARAPGRVFSPETSLTLLSTISGGMITFTGIVFSMIFVMVQFSSNSYSPRLAPFYLHDNVIKHSLGMFTATFLFTLTSIAWASIIGDKTIPDITVFISIAAVALSAILFLALIQRISVLQITSVLFMITRFGRKEILENYPVLITGNETSAEPGEKLDLPPLQQVITYEGISASLLDVNIKYLVNVAKRSDAVIEVLYAAGDLIPEGADVMKVFSPARQVSEWQAVRALRMGEQRTIDQDPKYAFRLIVDIAIRALSPAINDPTTAVMSLDRLEDLLRVLVHRDMMETRYYDKAGNLRVICQTPDWDDFLALAVDEIRIYGSSSIQVSRRLLAMLTDLEKIAPESRKPSIRDHIDRVEVSIKRAFTDKYDRADASQPDRQGIGLTRTTDDDVFA
ncbi:MAG: DUF2254 domain-containing protein [Chloroflexi bacterium]|nr:DUF2254 domain-containing protein [Chloroflexota bacterium]